MPGRLKRYRQVTSMTPPPVRGRPRSFDPARALDQALDVFWVRGLSASSLDELCAAMGIARPSLYAAFGDKEDLYLAAAGRFRERIAGAYRDATAGVATGHDTSLAFLRGAIEHYLSGPSPRGCLALCTATTEAASNPRIRALLAAMIRDLDRAFEAIVRGARDRGELPATADPVVLARLLSATQHTIAVRARAGTDPAELDDIARAGVAMVFGPPSVPSRRKPTAPAQRKPTAPAQRKAAAPRRRKAVG